MLCSSACTTTRPEVRALPQPKPVFFSKKSVGWLEKANIPDHMLADIIAINTVMEQLRAREIAAHGTFSERVKQEAMLW